jgi:hypothetical protein
MKIQDLLDSGRLLSGTQLEWKRRGERSFFAVVQDDGVLVLEDGTRHKSPSGAAKHIVGRPVDGWTVWKLPNGQPIGVLRLE